MSYLHVLFDSFVDLKGRFLFGGESFQHGYFLENIVALERSQR